MNIRALDRPDELRACVALQEETWGPAFSERVPYAVLWFTRRIGGVLLGAFDGDRLAGFVFGVTGWRNGEPVHWSDMLAVRAELRDRGIGIALKHAQRSALLDAGVHVANWTFDPLESRNAHVNFNRLGCVAGEYVRDVYGASDSPLHRGIGTDRLVVAWHLASSRVVARLSQPAPAANAHDDGAPVANAVSMRAGLPVCAEPDLTLDVPRLCIAIPASIQAVKQESPELAVQWRSCTRVAFEAYLARGYQATALMRMNEAVSAYLLECRATLD